MARVITITIPEDGDLMEHADYVAEVARQISDGYLSGHVAADQHWTSF